MDTELLRTFVEVNRTRHFGKAAANLYLTQSAVSARIRLLEQVVGVPVFTRTRNDIRLTPAGTKLLRYAETILTAWNRARQEIAVAGEERSALNVGAAPDMWDILLGEWLVALARERPDLAVNAEALDTDAQLRRLNDGTLELAFMLESPESSGLEVEEIRRLQFELVSTAPEASAAQALREGYVFVNWGPWFGVTHARHFPDLPPPAVRLGLGRLACELLLARGGAAYLPQQMTAPLVARGRLHVVVDAPTFERTAFGVFPSASANRHTIGDALEMLGHGGPARTERAGSA
ncbi:MAG: LysR family transcriptional regulator [Ectothiorhodospiraceae bacterium]|nr:LysR family transcriptional regulator [Chromatiales bacterium]MCP5156925.1 LysR family transcriptional regulator [Ectothiorhodospiraceae bacterium]